MYDLKNEVKISSDSLSIHEKKTVLKIKKYFILAVIPICTVFSVVSFKYMKSPYKYLAVLFMIVVLLIYVKNVFLSDENHGRILSVSREEIEYFDGEYCYKIPTKEIISLEDCSYYFDFSGKYQSGWNHHFVLHLSENCHVIRSTMSEEIVLTGEDISKIDVWTLVLKHDDYERVFRFLCDILQEIGVVEIRTKE